MNSHPSSPPLACNVQLYVYTNMLHLSASVKGQCHEKNRKTYEGHGMVENAITRDCQVVSFLITLHKCGLNSN